MFRKLSRVLVLTMGIGLFLAPPGFAAKFANQFAEFELPPQWQCNLEGAEWVCQSTNEGKKRDAIIVLAAKLKGDQDSLDQYLTYLKGAKAYTSVQGRLVKSEPKYAKTVNINGHPWVDSLHLESEIPGFYTRYLATVKQDIGVLVTYSIKKAKYQEYLNDFDTMVKTLKVFRKSGGINVAPQKTDLFQNTTYPKDVSPETVFPVTNPVAATDNNPPPKPAPASDNGSLVPILIIAAAIGYLVWRRRQSQGR